MARILQPDKAALASASALLSQGKVVGMPTETVYGLAGDATNEEAVLAIYRTKSRPAFDPLIVHIPRELNSVAEMANAGLIDSRSIDSGTTAKIHALIIAFWPGPMTLILPKHESVSDLITSGLKKVGVRMPDHPVAQQLLRTFGRPLAAPSANRFGRISPTSALDVKEELGDLIELILDGGPCDRGVESTVIALSDDGNFDLLRPGSLPREDIEEVLGARLSAPSAASSKASPGTLASHYAPNKRLLILPKPIEKMSREDWGSLGLAQSTLVSLLIPCGPSTIDNGSIPFSVISRISLSEKGVDTEASRNLFRAMRTLDGDTSQVILCDPVRSDEGLWHAVGDRLKRASK